jgi:hypothetical protein
MANFNKSKGGKRKPFREKKEFQEELLTLSMLRSSS